MARWRRIAADTIAAGSTDRVSLAAAGCAFYATLSLFPGISMLLSVYGLIFDLASVVPHLAVLRDLLPAPAFGLIENRVLQLVAQPRESLSFGLAIAFLLSVWSSASASKAILSAVNVAYDATEQRGFFRFQAIGLGMTLGSAVCAILAIAVLLVLPPAIRFAGLPGTGAVLIQAASFGLVVAGFGLGVALLYARGPVRERPAAARVGPGVTLATLLWLSGSWLLSIYVAKLANFDATYGSIGAVVGIMLWFYLSAYAILIGAELNAGLEKPAREELAPA